MTRTKLAPAKVNDCTPLDDASTWDDRKATQLAHRAVRARKASGKRRLVDPATCDREYSRAEMEFLQAIQEYKARSGRMFPTWGEVLVVVQRLGYQKVS